MVDSNKLRDKKENQMIQTWLPLPSFSDSIASLTPYDLAQQRLQVLEIMETVHAISEADSDLPGDYDTHDLEGHPILDMWKGYELQLIEYGLQCCERWCVLFNKRVDPIYPYLANHQEWATTEEATFALPNWFGDIEFHLSHQAWLRRSNPAHYGKLFLDDGENRKLIWPQSNYA